MKTELVFFSSLRDSKFGTTRGVVAFLFLFVGLMPWLKCHEWGWHILLCLALCSAIGVQLPCNYTTAGVYGLLIGGSPS